MVALAHPPAKTPTYVKVANFPGLYRYARSGRYHACKKQGGIRVAQERQQDCFAAVDVTFPSLPRRALQLIDVQNLFCEVDKYARMAYPQLTGVDGRIRIKQRFQPAATMLPLW